MAIHHFAIKHLDQAITLAADDSYDSFRYAALDLRYAIEYLVYKFLPHYKDEVIDEVLNEWRPNVILDALVEANPDLPHSFSLRIASEDENHTPVGP
jgi:hypothetical protein